MHIHEVLDLLAQNNRYSVSELIDDISENFGEDVCFTSCAGHEFGIDQVLSFLMAKGKIKIEGDQVVPIRLVCDH